MSMGYLRTGSRIDGKRAEYFLCLAFSIWTGELIDFLRNSGWVWENTKLRFCGAKFKRTAKLLPFASAILNRVRNLKISQNQTPSFKLQTVIEDQLTVVSVSVNSNVIPYFESMHLLGTGNRNLSSVLSPVWSSSSERD